MTPYLFTSETDLDEGYYWVRIGADKPEVAFLDANGDWFIAGDELPPAEAGDKSHVVEVTVLSERLVGPWTAP